MNEDSESETISAKGAVPLLDGTLGCMDYNLSIRIIKGAYQYTLSGFQHRDFFCDFGPCEGYPNPNFTLVLTSKEWDKMIIYESRKTIDETVKYLAEEMKNGIKWRVGK